VARKFFVDWSDPSFPKVMDIKFAPELPESLAFEPLMFGEAKAEIIEHFQNIIRQCRQQIDGARSLRMSDVVVS
jgi:hypothetical protein